MKSKTQKCTVNYSNTDSTLSVNISDTSINADGSFELHHTFHSLNRTKKRGISEKLLANLIGFGKCYQKQGLLYYVLSNKEVEFDSLDVEINDSLVAVVKDDVIITSYYTSKTSGHRHINKKGKQFHKNYRQKFWNN